MDDDRYDSLLSRGALGILPKPYDIHQLTSVFDKISVSTKRGVGA
jgi:hypothetical protein